ncbi:hypothetical protein NZK35_33550 [Stieleria sp. ICT_E10.1]|uniref:hypothetical protein n=1 Tax=Stieleria sedimenti TaxID=2976331 RepID=UPI0021805A49|nr:hypothetical protein [Stieleria sedimenti]MCS7471600.1 hypothetical protein [Stieleria sedimenti]
MATLMLDCNADLRSIQTLLSYEQLNTTQIDTHVSIKRLREVHDRPPTDRWKDASELQTSHHPLRRSVECLAVEILRRGFRQANLRASTT